MFKTCFHRQRALTVSSKNNNKKVYQVFIGDKIQLSELSTHYSELHIQTSSGYLPM